MADQYMIISLLCMNFSLMFIRRKGKQGYIAMKIDLEKAYDLLNWDYIFVCLQTFGFSSQRISLIKNCITLVSFSLLTNGSAQGYFKPSRGIRQGDLLSPYLFILCMEPLIRHLNALTTNSEHQVGLLSSPLWS